MDGDARNQSIHKEDPDDGGHSPQHEHREAGGGEMGRAQPHSATQSNGQMMVQQKQQSSPTSHSRSDAAGDRPRPSLDPTGMFRNRGRRVVAGSRSSPVRTSPSPVNGQEKPERLSYRMRYDASTSAETNKIAETVQSSLPQSRIGNDDDGEPRANEGDNCHDEGETQHKHCRKIIDDSGGERNAKQLDCSGITANRSRDINDNEHTSDIGSTVSVMGSIVGEGKAVKQRMADDVAEVADEEGSAGSGAGTTTQHENDALNDTLASQADDAGDDVLNVSMEVNADTTDTSLFEDHPVNDAAIENESDGGGCRDTAATGDDVDANNKNTIHPVDGAGHEPMEEQESPLRAAFRRSAQGLSRNLPPLSAQMLAAAPYRATATSAIDKAATTASMFPQFARQCFSFEDTTVDDDAFLLMPGQPHLGGEAGQYYGLSGPHWDDAPAEGISGSDGKASTPASGDLFRSTAPNWYPLHLTRLSNGEPGSPFRVIRPSKTWDHNGVGQQQRINPSSEGIRQTASFDPWSPPSIGRESWGSWKWKDPADAPIGRAGKQDEHWKKLEVEREDAIDLLSCLVEQSLDFNPMDECLDAFFCDECQQTPHKEQPFSGCDGCIEKLSTSLKGISVGSSEREMTSDAVDALFRSHEFALEVRRSCVSAKKWLQSIGSAQSYRSGDVQDSERNRRIDAAALRAQLHSVEDVTLSREEEIRRLNEELSKCRAEIGRLNSSQSSKLQPAEHQPMLLMPANRSILSSSSSSDDREGNELVLRSPDAKLCESHNKSFLQWEKKIEAELQLESRKEILLLRAALERANQKISALELQGKEPFSSEIEPIEAAKEEGDLLMKIADEIEATVASASTDDEENNSNDGIAPSVRLDDPALEKELDEYRTALIASIRAEENERSMHAESNTDEPDEPNADNHLSESHSSEQMVNIRMLDGENFSTEWGQMALPPLPDHGLHSPLVDAILSAWTDDSDTKTALKGWVEDILSGTKAVDLMPCLKLSGLDHQVRDGFVMHVLPLLLSRNDLHVEITSRAHRQTTYDIAVSVRQTVATRDAAGSQTPKVHQKHTSGEIQHHLMAYQATQNGAAINERDESHGMSPKKPLLAGSFPVLMRNSSNASMNRAPSNAGSIFSAVTMVTANQTPSRRGPLIGRSMYTSLSSEIKGDNSFTANHASPSLMDDLSAASSADDDDIEDTGSKSFGSIRSLGMGFLSRRKPSPTQHDSDGAAVIRTPERESRTGEEWSRAGKIHRVVTAPPGKLGITFVEYRGHAVVSRVSPESPLAGWVFPTDELIAIDDVPVSGLRTKEVVKVLTDKGAERRNLTMVSSRK
ncbi:hypothetical protein ACHAXT_010715 [Thalassiosira profunda]